MPYGLGSRGYLSLGNMLREARRMCHLHPSAITKKFGYSDCRILARMENGELKVPLTDLPVLAKTLNLPLDTLFELTSGYHPGLVQKAREIGLASFDVQIEDHLLVAIVLCGIERQQDLRARH